MTEWEPAFEGQRPPFERGNQLARRHGATAMVTLAPRAEEIADGLREIVPARSEADEPTLRLLALVLARVEAANAWLAEHGVLRADGQPQGVLKALSTWENTAARLANDLALNPTARAKLGLNVARARGAVLDEYLRENYGVEERGTVG